MAVVTAKTETRAAEAAAIAAAAAACRWPSDPLGVTGDGGAPSVSGAGCNSEIREQQAARGVSGAVGGRRDDDECGGRLQLDRHACEGRVGR